MDNEEDKNVIVELNNDIEDTLFDEDIAKIKESTNELVIGNDTNKKGKKNKKNKEKVKKDCFYKKLSKKGKIIFWISISLITLIIIGLLLYFFVIRKNKIKKLDVIVKTSNYSYVNGKLIFYDGPNNEIGRYECNVKKAKKCYLAKFTSEDTFDAPKVVDLDNKEIELSSEIYNNMFVFIQDGDVINLYDLKSNKILGKYNLIKLSKNPLKYVIAKDIEDKYGIIDISTSTMKIVLPFNYSYLGISDNDEVFVVKEGETSFLVNQEGVELSSKTDGEIRKFTDKYISLYNNKYNLYDYSGNDMLKLTFDYIDFYTDFVITITEGKLTVYDNNLVKLNERGILLNSMYYNPLNRINEKGEVVETLKAYEFSFENGVLKVKLSDKNTKEINVYEALVNKKYNYVNYSDGILYFYKDLEKTELLGKYTCTNKNKIFDANSEYTNCFIAKESSILNQNNSGYAPIISNRYALIYDCQTGSSLINISLYDFVKTEVLIKYQAVDTGYGSSNITHIQNTDKNITAQNMSNNYGMITIKENGPKKIINFGETINNKLDGTKSISRFDNDYYLVKRTTYNYLYTLEGIEVVQSQFDIISKNGKYLIVYDAKNKEYLLYDIDKGKITSDPNKKFSSLKLYNDFYLGIENNKLYLYKYNNTTAYPSLGIDLPLNYKEYKVDVENKKITIIDVGGQETIYTYIIDANSIIIKKEDGGAGE
ncbi:MAG: hypothetical protein GX951_04045 [Mollicutes bacterium]|nr:hypothetical protein [Mollicutes bacterium]